MGMEFFHDFSGKIPLKRQFKKVKRKYDRRIERFKRNILEPTVFIRYIKDQKELDYWLENQEKVLELLKSYNSNNEIILVANDELKQEQKDRVVYWIEKDEGDSVSRCFFDKNAELLSIIQNLRYERSNKIVHKKQFCKLYRRVINRYYAYKPEYIHCKEYE